MADTAKSVAAEIRWTHQPIVIGDGLPNFDDVTQDERDRLAYVIAAALSEVGFPCTPQPHPKHEGNWIFKFDGEFPPMALAERARAVALASIGKPVRIRPEAGA